MSKSHLPKLEPSEEKPLPGSDTEEIDQEPRNWRVQGGEGATRNPKVRAGGKMASAALSECNNLWDVASLNNQPWS